MPETLCPISGKITYPSKILAVAAAVRITNKCGAYRRAYKCSDCGAYHLTHKRLKIRSKNREHNQGREKYYE